VFVVSHITLWPALCSVAYIDCVKHNLSAHYFITRGFKNLFWALVF